MSKLKLIVGDKSLSSWSMRAWLALKASGLPFEEVMILLDRPETKVALTKHSPSKKVPCLIHGDVHVWDSLAICEYIFELAPDQELWPKDSAKRAMARSYSAEMHSGFPNLRNQLSMDLHLNIKIRHISDATISEIQRIISLWETALKTNGGPFLFGKFGIADAFYAPVVFRFQSYGVEIESPHARQYMNRVQEHPLVREWTTAALKEKPLYIKFAEQNV